MTSLHHYRPGLWLTNVELPNEGFAVRGAVILGSQQAVVWDTLTHPRDMQPVRDLVGNRPLTVVYSHADWDHIWGTAGLPPTPIIAHAECAVRFASDVPATLHAKQATQPGQWDAVRLVPPTALFQETLMLDLGDISLTLAHLPGHTADCIVGLIAEWGILLAGDTVETPLPFLNPDSSRSRWIEGLEVWASDPRVQHVIPAHGDCGGPTLLRRTIAYLRDLPHSAVPADLDDFYRETHAENVRLSTRSGALNDGQGAA